MKATTLKKSIVTKISQLSKVQMQSVYDFLDYLKEREATFEVLSDKKFAREVRKARQDWLEGKEDRFTPWRKIRRYV